MRKSLAILLHLFLASGCAARPQAKPVARPLVVAPAAPRTPTFARPALKATPDAMPHVVRRLVAEERELVERSVSMATELRDPRGRQRALDEANELSADLARIAAPLDSPGVPHGDTLDDAMTKLQLLDTRVALLFEKLRTATDRTTAVLIE